MAARPFPNGQPFEFLAFANCEPRLTASQNVTAPKLILGNMNAIACKEIFPLFKNNEIWAGYKRFGGGMNMIQPAKTFDASKTKSYSIDDHGHIIKNIMGVIWFTNLDIRKRHEDLILVKRYYGHEDEYPKYDNYDAINIDKVVNIPCDYDGMMGVPITFLDKYNPEQFEIIDARKITKFDRQKQKSTMLIKDSDSAIGGKPKYARVAIRNKHPEL